MKILFVTYDFPYPTNSGGKTRAFNLLKHKSKDIEMYLFSFVREGFDKKAIAKVKALGISDVKFIRRADKKSIKSLLSLLHAKHSIFHSLYFNDVVQKLLIAYVKEKNIDVVHFESYYTAFYLSEQLRTLGVRQIFGTENIEAKVYDEYIRHRVSPFFKPLFLAQNKKIQKEEEDMFALADITLSVTEAEKRYIEKFTNNKVYVIPNGVDLSLFKYKLKEPNVSKVLLFVGNFTYHPNVDAAGYFYKAVLPKLPDAYSFHVIGKNAEKLAFASDPRVVAHNYVMDIVATYAYADVLVSPMRTGGGTNFKILEAMAVGLPIVAFPHRIEAMQAKGGIHVLTATSSSEFAEKVIKITNNEALRKKLSINARKLVEEKYSWKAIGKEMNSIWRMAGARSK
jgi:glycosyltransferase involved in cell wall biosynthesis